MNTLPLIPLLLGLSLCPMAGSSQSAGHIHTDDIVRFWAACDQLSPGQTRADSIRILQEVYLDSASAGLQQFIRIRNFSAEEYVKLLGKYPRFWASIRPYTTRIQSRRAEIEAVLDEMTAVLPGFRRPDVYFTIGCLRTGGTISGDMILIGSEIAAADTLVHTGELGSWLRQTLGHTGDIVAMVAHEAVHTWQRGIPVHEIFRLMKHKRLSMLNTALVEGGADFITDRMLGMNINTKLHQYGRVHDERLWCEFREAIDQNPFDYSQWLYNGHRIKGRPADLGYYMGYRISEAFYDSMADKRRALRILMKRGQYKKVFRRSGFRDRPCVQETSQESS